MTIIIGEKNMSIIDFESKQKNLTFPNVFDISPEEVLEKKDLVVLIDVRGEDEFTGELGHIPGAQLLTLDKLPAKTNTLPKDKTIVLICRSGNRSAHAAQHLAEAGFENSFNMKGGMMEWNSKQFEVEK